MRGLQRYWIVALLLNDEKWIGMAFENAMQFDNEPRGREGDAAR